MLKVLYLPLGEQASTEEAFRNVGVQLEVCDFWGIWERTKSKVMVEQDFLNKVRVFQPNLIHMQLQFTGVIESNVLAEARKLCPNVVITNWSGDCRATAMGDFTKVGNAVDYSLISSTGQLEMYKAAGCKNIRYWQIGYDPKNHYPLNYTDFQHDAVFIGNNYGNTFPDGQLRTSAVTFLDTALERFAAFGSGYSNPRIKPISPKQVNEVYNKSICAVSISNFNNVAHYFSDRLLYCIASGRPTVSWYFPGCESYFVEGSEIFYARNNMELADAIKYCKANPEIAKQVGINGHKRVLRSHTFTSRVIELLHITKLSHLV
jgi:spore maturation protein CgeB